MDIHEKYLEKRKITKSPSNNAPEDESSFKSMISNGITMMHLLPHHSHSNLFNKKDFEGNSDNQTGYRLKTVLVLKDNEDTEMMTCTKKIEDNMAIPVKQITVKGTNVDSVNSQNNSKMGNLRWEKEYYLNSLTPIRSKLKKSEDKEKVDIYQKITSFITNPVGLGEFTDFLMKPLPKGKALICNIKMVYSSLFQKFYPKYYASINTNDRLLLVAKKIFQPTSSVYHICINDESFDSSSHYYIGKISSNFIGNEFNIFGKGEKHSKAKSSTEMRQHYGNVSYEINFLGMKGLRRMKVYLPSVDSDGVMKKYIPTSTNKYIKDLYMKDPDPESKCKIAVYKNKEPEWSTKCNGFILNFNGRVQAGSPKNFQLISDNSSDTDTDSEVILQFGKISDTVFAMDFQFPLSPFQAFAICLTSLATKISCE